MNLERLPSIVAFKPERELSTRPRTHGSVIGRLQKEQTTVSAYKVKATFQKRPLMESLNDKLLWQIAVLEDIRNQEQFHLMRIAGETVPIPKDIYGTVKIPVFDDKAHNMPISKAAHILRIRVEFAMMNLDPHPERQGNHFSIPESFAYALDIYNKLK